MDVINAVHAVTRNEHADFFEKFDTALECPLRDRLGFGRLFAGWQLKPVVMGFEACVEFDPGHAWPLMVCERPFVCC